MRIYPLATTIFLDGQRSVIRTKQSRATYEQLLHTFSKYTDKVNVEAITEQDLISFLNRTSTSKNFPGRQLAPGTVARNRNILVQFFTFLHDQGMLEANPAARLRAKVPVRVKNTRKSNWLSTEKLHEILDALPSTSPVERRNRALVYVIAQTGIRRSEASQLTWDNVDLGQGEIYIFGKGEKPRMVGISDDLEAELRSYRTWYVAESGGIPGRRPVFPAFRRQFTKDGEEYFTLWDQPLGPDGVCETVKAAGRAVGLEDLATHDLRRTLAQIMLDQGYTLRDIADMLGHESVGTTEAYLRKNMARGVKVGKRLSLRTA